MRIKIELVAKQNQIIVQTGFNSQIQAFIYNNLAVDQARWLHETGFVYEKRTFRLFVFSDPLERGRYDRERKLFHFGFHLSFYLASPVNWILEETAQGLLSKQGLNIGKNELNVSSVAIMRPPTIESSPIRVKALTPIEVHSTYIKENGHKRTDYYTPFDNDFSDLVNRNMRKKWQALHKEECPHQLRIRPLFASDRPGLEKIRTFGTGAKNTVIKGWLGYYELYSDPEMLSFALDTGLGSRNSQGFGMVELAEREREV